MKSQIELVREEEIRAEDSDMENYRPIRQAARRNLPPGSATNTTSRGGVQQVSTVPGVNSHQSRYNTPLTSRSTINTSRLKSNNKYPDVDNFHGTKGSRAWDAWEAHLRSKFRNSWELFEEEGSKINYIRDHCKDIAF